MNIESLALKIMNSIGNIDFNQESLNYPVLKFRIQKNDIKFFYRENFIKRSKSHKAYNTFFEITLIDESDLPLVIKNIEELLCCKYCIDKNKVYSNISEMSEDEIIDFINNFQ